MSRLVPPILMLCALTAPSWGQAWTKCDEEPTQHGCPVSCTHGYMNLYWYVIGFDVTFVTEAGCVPSAEEGHCDIKPVDCGAHYNCSSSTTCPGPCWRWGTEKAPGCVGTITPEPAPGDPPLDPPPPPPDN